MVDLAHYNRMEPRPRENDFTHGLAAELRDPLWLLTRQWQVGEFNGEDSGSPAYVSYLGSKSQLPRWQENGNEHELDTTAPLEPQTLREPFQPDLSLRVELGQDFGDLLETATGNATLTQQLLRAFRNSADFQLKTPDDTNDLDPVDPATKRFLAVCAANAIDGFALYQLGVAIAGGTGSVPAAITTDPSAIASITAALAQLVKRVVDVFGALSETLTPVAWDAERLQYGLSVVAADPSGQGNASFAAYPDTDGEFEWFSFDVSHKDPSASESAHSPVTFVTLPSRLRFPGMPATRFWNFEENSLALPDIRAGKVDLLRLLSMDFLLVHSHDWYRIPYRLEPGMVARTDYLLVRDIFGKDTVVYGANSKPDVAAANRWSLFSLTDDDSDPTKPSANYFVLPQSGGVAMRLGSVLEDVRFGRDEMANMAWGIERVTTSPIGEQRSGRERDAEIDARRQPPAAPATANDFPLRYSIESEVPANFVPLFPVLAGTDSNDPSIALRRGQAQKVTTHDGVKPVPVLSAVLNPVASGTAYDIAEEEIPRSGLRLERIVCRTRWVDGSSHLWVQRRRRIGAGEAQSGLQFDQALPKEE